VQVITPIRKKCDCGHKVTDHHFLCNACWGKRERKRWRKKHEHQPGLTDKILIKQLAEEKKQNDQVLNMQN
jgi:hypothetical protein